MFNNTFIGLNLLKALSFCRSYCVQVFKKTFVFTGGEIVNEFLMSTGYLPGAHSRLSRLQKSRLTASRVDKKVTIPSS
jgi:hypothetical protein